MVVHACIFNLYRHRYFLMSFRMCMYFTSTFELGLGTYFLYFCVPYFNVHLIFVHIALSWDFSYQWVY